MPAFFLYICAYMSSVNQLLEKSFRVNWDLPALSNYQGETLLYRDLASRIHGLHLLFTELGIQRGDKIAICARNQANWGVSFLAALTYGAVPVPLLHEFQAENIHYLVGHSEARILFADSAILDKVDEAEMPGLLKVINLESLSENASPEIGREDLHYYEDKPDELALINYTSGTSGFSKGVMIPYRALMCNIIMSRETAEPQLHPGSQLVAMLPSAHMYGLMFDFLHQMTVGSHVHFLTRTPSPNVILKVFSEIRPDLIIVVPLILEKVYKTQIKPVAEKYRFFLSLPLVGRIIKNRICRRLVDAFGGRFEEVIVGGAAFNPEVERFLHDIKFPFLVGYGMTECAPIVTFSKWYEHKVGACGKAIPGCTIRIDSPDQRHVAGEIQIKGDNVFLGYFKNEAATREAFTEDGWFRTGDMGVVDKDGFLFLRGRSKCMILGPSGQNIYPEELEVVIDNTPYVAASLVIEDDKGLTALVYPDYGKGAAENLTLAQVEEKLNESLPKINAQLPSYAQIHKLEFRSEDFERTPKKSIKRYLYQR